MQAIDLTMSNSSITATPGRHTRNHPVTAPHTTPLEYRFGKMLLFAAIVLLLLAAGNAGAEVDPYRLYLAQRGDIPWQSLSPEEQNALRRYRNNWDSYSGKRQQEMRRGAQRYMELPPQKRREVEQQRRHYQQLSPEQRRNLREEYRRQKH